MKITVWQLNSFAYTESMCIVFLTSTRMLSFDLRTTLQTYGVSIESHREYNQKIVIRIDVIDYLLRRYIEIARTRQFIKDRDWSVASITLKLDTLKCTRMQRSLWNRKQCAFSSKIKMFPRVFNCRMRFLLNERRNSVFTLRLMERSTKRYTTNKTNARAIMAYVFIAQFLIIEAKTNLIC